MARLAQMRKGLQRKSRRICMGWSQPSGLLLAHASRLVAILQSKIAARHASRLVAVF
jgi:hypothetical protein